MRCALSIPVSYPATLVDRSNKPHSPSRMESCRSSLFAFDALGKDARALGVAGGNRRYFGWNFRIWSSPYAQCTWWTPSCNHFQRAGNDRSHRCGRARHHHESRPTSPVPHDTDVGPDHCISSSSRTDVSGSFGLHDTYRHSLAATRLQVGVIAANTTSVHTRDPH
jgi:hypothetical protein